MRGKYVSVWPAPNHAHLYRELPHTLLSLGVPQVTDALVDAHTDAMSQLACAHHLSRSHCVACILQRYEKEDGFWNDLLLTFAVGQTQAVPGDAGWCLKTFVYPRPSESAEQRARLESSGGCDVVEMVRLVAH